MGCREQCGKKLTVYGRDVKMIEVKDKLFYE